MARVYEIVELQIPDGETLSNELTVETLDADQIIVLAPAVLAENVKFQVAFADGEDYQWVNYDNTNFTAAGYRLFEAIGLRYRLQANVGVDATRVFAVNKRVK